MSESHKALWLVKSGGRILGPYTEGQVESLLRSKELVALDEACLPLRRWNYLRDEPTFSKVVEEIRHLEFANSDMDDHTETVGVSSDEMTQSLTEDIGTQPGGGAEIVYDSVEEVVEPPKDPRASRSVPRYGTAPIARQEVSQFSKTFLKLGFVAILIAVGVFGVRFYLTEPAEQAAQSKDLVEEGFKALRFGANEKALELFDQSYKIDPTRQEIYVFLGALLIQVDGQTVRGKRFLNEVLDFDGKDKKYALTGLGIANLLDGEVRFAEKNFQSALNIDPEYKSAMVNLGVARAYRQEHDAAIGLYNKVIGLGPDDNIVYFLKADSLLEKWKRSKDKALILQAMDAIKSVRINGRDYLQESLIYTAYLESLLNSRISASSIEKIIEVNPHLTDDHKHDIMIYQSNSSWNQLLEKCDAVTKAAGKAINATILKSLCFSKAGQHERAKQTIRQALSQERGNILAQTMYAYILQEAGQEEASLVALGRATEMNRNKEFMLPIYLQARFCYENKDFECARENWMEIVKNQSDSLTAIVQLANLNFDEGKTLGLEREIFKAFSLSRTYIPLLKLKDKSEELDAKGFGG